MSSRSSSPSSLHDPDVKTRDQHDHPRAGVARSDLDVAKHAVVAKRHTTAAVDPGHDPPVGSQSRHPRAIMQLDVMPAALLA